MNNEKLTEKLSDLMLRQFRAAANLDQLITDINQSIDHPFFETMILRHKQYRKDYLMTIGLKMSLEENALWDSLWVKAKNKVDSREVF